jgi:FixJ family two-component response regulator
LFEPFVTSKVSGMGLGLSLSRTLLRHQGGELWSERSRLGGARFVIRLAAQLSAQTNVFLIDDDPSVRDSLTLLLSLKGIRTQPFATAESFVETYRPEWCGCVLTDLRMPEMSGLELQETLGERHKEVTVVVLTGHGDVAAARAAHKNGPFDFLEKPIDDAMLLGVLNSALRTDRARRTTVTARAAIDWRIERMAQREQEILEFSGTGQQNREIAAPGISAPHRRGAQGTHYGTASRRNVNASRRTTYCVLARGAPNM